MMRYEPSPHYGTHGEISQPAFTLPDICGKRETVDLLVSDRPVTRGRTSHPAHSTATSHLS